MQDATALKRANLFAYIDKSWCMVRLSRAPVFLRKQLVITSCGSHSQIGPDRGSPFLVGLKTPVELKSRGDICMFRSMPCASRVLSDSVRPSVSRKILVFMLHSYAYISLCIFNVTGFSGGV